MIKFEYWLCVLCIVVLFSAMLYSHDNHVGLNSWLSVLATSTCLEGIRRTVVLDSWIGQIKLSVSTVAGQDLAVAAYLVAEEVLVVISSSSSTTTTTTTTTATTTTSTSRGHSGCQIRIIRGPLAPRCPAPRSVRLHIYIYIYTHIEREREICLYV